MKNQLRLLDGLPFVKIYVFFTIGIILRECFPIASFNEIICFIIGGLLFALSLYIQKKFLWIGSVFFWAYGFHSMQMKRPELQAGQILIHATVVEEPVAKPKSHLVLVQLNHVKKCNRIIPIESKQLMAAYLPKSDEVKALRYGDKITAYLTLDTLLAPLNPYEFNFKKKMERRDIYYSGFIPISNLTIHPCRDFSIKKICFQIRRHLLKVLEENISNISSRNIAKSLIIGDRAQIGDDILDAYSNTGTIHILSVSGLHVGVFVWLFGLFFNKYFPTWRKSRFVSVLFFVWLYGLISGMSPPVMRCAIMFSIIELGVLLDRKANIFNLIAGAAWMILLFDTQMLFDLGYQLSFLAMTGIVLLHPKIYTKIVFEQSIFDKIWEMLSGTFSAWLFTFPIILFSFHKVSLIGNLANLIAIPISTGILYAGLILFITSPIRMIATGIGQGIDWAIQIQDRCILFFEKMPLSHVDNFYINESALLTIYGAIGTFALFLFFKRSIYLIAALLCLWFIPIQQRWVSANSDAYSLVTFNFKKNTLLGIKNRDTLYLIGDSCATYQQHKIRDFALNGGVHEVIKKRENIISFKQKKYILIGNASIISRDSFELAILSQKACRGYRRLLDEIAAKKWILDSSISPYYREKIEKEMMERNISYYSVSPTNFAFIQKL